MASKPTLRGAASTPDEVQQIYLPGVGATFMAPQMADRMAQFILKLKSQDIEPRFDNAYRSREEQAALHHDPKATTPAENSLHSAGLAVDIAGWHAMDAPTQAKYRAAAAEAGLMWGGTFRKRPDPNHFYYDPGTDRNRLIDRFDQGIKARQGQIPNY